MNNFMLAFTAICMVSAALAVGSYVMVNRALKDWAIKIKSHVEDLQRLLNEFEILKAELEAAEQIEKAERFNHEQKKPIAKPTVIL